MKTDRRWGWSLCLSLGLLAGLPGAATALGQHKEDTGQKIYKQTLKGTVWILRRVDSESLITGSGAFVHADARYGYIITNYHVVGEARGVALFFPVYNKGEPIAERQTYLQLMRNNRAIVGEVLARSMKVDLAVVRIAKKDIPAIAKSIPLAAASPKPADHVHSVGSPGAVGALWVYTPGSVRQVYKAQLRSKLDENTIMEIDAWMILTNSETNEGDSGGPLVNDNGQLIGITQGGSTRARAVSTFVDIREVKAILAGAKVRVPVGGGKETARKDDGGDGGEGGGAGGDKGDTASNNSRSTGKNDGDKAEKDRIMKLAQELIDAKISDRSAVLEKFQSTKGADYTTALAAAIPRLSGSYRDKARTALAERLCRMTASTLKNYLEDDSPEIRRGAIRAITSKEAKELMKNLVPLLTDNVSDVADEAYEALCKLSGQDFGRAPEKWKQHLSK